MSINRKNIFNTLIEYLNYQKLEFLMKSIGLSDNVYSELKNIIGMTYSQKYYYVKVKENTLNLQIFGYSIVPESEIKPIAQNESVDGNLIRKDFAGQAKVNNKED